MAPIYRVVTNTASGKISFIKDILPATNIDYDAHIKRTKHDIEVARVNLSLRKRLHEEWIQRSLASEI